ncbi:MAG: hypothetical protein ACKV2T_14275 [Kofleriaceae bacterium]
MQVAPRRSLEEGICADVSAIAQSRVRTGFVCGGHRWKSASRSRPQFFRSGWSVRPVTVLLMGEKRQPSRSTQKLSSEELARMARESAETPTEDLTPIPPENDWLDVEMALGSQANVAPLYARTTTVSDPMTMALLAEVARSSRTMEIEPGTAEEAHDTPVSDEHEEITKPEIVHPHVKRRG